MPLRSRHIRCRIIPSVKVKFMPERIGKTCWEYPCAPIPCWCVYKNKAFPFFERENFCRASPPILRPERAAALPDGQRTEGMIARECHRDGVATNRDNQSLSADRLPWQCADIFEKRHVQRQIAALRHEP